MGRYLSCGIATQIIIYKRYHEENDKILERIGKNFDLNIYDRTDCENGIILKLKEDMIEQHAIDFAIEQTEKFSERNKKEAKQRLETLRGLRFKDMLEKAKENHVYEFYFYEGNRVCNDISYLDPDGNCKVICDIVDIISNGKVLLECYEDLFTYFRNCIIQSSKNPIRTAAVVTIVG